MRAGVAALTAFGAAGGRRPTDQGDRLRGLLVEDGVHASGRGSLVRLRESVDPALLWWRLYLDGGLTGTNGLLALSTPMDDGTVASRRCHHRGSRPLVSGARAQGAHMGVWIR